MSGIYFTDRNLGKQFPQLLAAAGLHVERHGDLFLPDARDEEWLAHCGANRRIAVTHDRRIRHRPNERDAVIQHDVALLVLIGNLPFPELARHFVATVPRIERFVERHPTPFIAKVYRAETRHLGGRLRPGRVELWYSA